MPALVPDGTRAYKASKVGTCGAADARSTSSDHASALWRSQYSASISAVSVVAAPTLIPGGTAKTQPGGGYTGVTRFGKPVSRGLEGCLHARPVAGTAIIVGVGFFQVFLCPYQERSSLRVDAGQRRRWLIQPGKQPPYRSSHVRNDFKVFRAQTQGLRVDQEYDLRPGVMPADFRRTRHQAAAVGVTESPQRGPHSPSQTTTAPLARSCRSPRGRNRCIHRCRYGLCTAAPWFR